MRIIGTIAHPNLKITIFKTDNRISVKFENEGYEQTVKFGMDERMGTVEAVQKWADAVFLEGVLRRMQDLHQQNLSALARAFPAAGEEEFETII